MKDEREPDQHEQELGRKVQDREEDVQPSGFPDADDVEEDENDDDDGPADDVPRVFTQWTPEDREVMRHEERRDGDRDDVVEHLGPRRSERHELVKGVPGEARRTTCLGKANRPLGVRDRRRSKDEAADHEDERRQPEGDPGNETERVVDRGADVPVGGREERRGSEDALEPLSPSSPPSPKRRRCSHVLPPAHGAGA
jgi:hypothetical protein